MVAEGDRVAVRWMGEGTGGSAGHPAHWQARPDDEHRHLPAGRGKIAEHWEQWDRLHLLQQLGVMPTPSQEEP
jgi:SnoaL-like polyketide cyclase